MKISIVIPVFNEEKFIIETLNNIQFQKKKFDLEIIVVDDKSTDNTLNLLKNNENLYDKLIENESNLGRKCFEKRISKFFR